MAIIKKQPQAPEKPKQIVGTVTHLFEARGGIRRMINEITFSSSFSSVPVAQIAKEAKRIDDTVHVSSPMSHPLVQLMVARDLRNGWVNNGPHPNAEYTIEQNGELVR